MDKVQVYFKGLISNELPRENLILQYGYNIMQTSDESRENFQLGVICGSNIKFSKVTS